MTESPAPEEVLQQLIHEYRHQVAALNEEEKQLRGIWHFEEPCQILDHWIRPLDLHLITVVHSPRGRDGLVHVEGPLEYQQLLDSFQKVLDLDLWDAQATFPQDGFSPRPVSVPPGRSPTLRDVHKEELSEFVNSLQPAIFRKPPASTGEGHVVRRTPEISYIQWWGPLSELDPKERIRHEVAQARRSFAEWAAGQAERAQEGARPTGSIATPPHDRKWDGYWTHIHPPISIGPLNNPNLLDLSFRTRQDPFDMPPTEFREALGGRVLFTTGGFIGLREEHPVVAAKFLNLVSYLLTRDGTLCYYSGPHDLGRFMEAPAGATFGRFESLEVPPPEERQSAEPFWRRTDVFGTLRPLRYIEGDRFVALLAEAERLGQTDVSGEVVAVHEAETLFEQRMYTHSLLFSWFAIERLLYRRLGAHLTSKGEPDAILEHFRKQSVGPLIRVLGGADAAFVPDRAHLTKLKEIRDAAAHNSDSVTRDQALRCVEEAKRLLEFYLP